MGNRLPYTPTSKIKNALRVLWMRSRERAQALKDSQYCCCQCKRKQSKAKVIDPATQVPALEVHHLDGIDWTEIISYIRSKLLSTPDRLAPLCPECHEKLDEHRKLKH